MNDSEKVEAIKKLLSRNIELFKNQRILGFFHDIIFFYIVAIIISLNIKNYK